MYGVWEYKLTPDKAKLQGIPAHRLRMLPWEWFYEA